MSFIKMKIFSILGVIFILIASSIATSTQAQTMMCNERTTVLESLKVNFNEELTELGVAENGIVVAFTVSP